MACSQCWGLVLEGACYGGEEISLCQPSQLFQISKFHYSAPELPACKHRHYLCPAPYPPPTHQLSRWCISHPESGASPIQSISKGCFSSRAASPNTILLSAKEWCLRTDHFGSWCSPVIQAPVFTQDFPSPSAEMDQANCCQQARFLPHALVPPCQTD